MKFYLKNPICSIEMNYIFCTCFNEVCNYLPYYSYGFINTIQDFYIFPKYRGNLQVPPYPLRKTCLWIWGILVTRFTFTPLPQNVYGFGGF